MRKRRRTLILSFSPVLRGGAERPRAGGVLVDGRLFGMVAG